MVQWTIELVINDDFIALDKPEEQKEFCQIISKIENQELVKIDKNNEIYFQEYLFQIQSSIPKAVSKQDLLDIYEKLNNFLELYQNESDRIIAYFFGVLIWISYALSIDAENDFDRYMDFVVKNNFHIGGFLENFVTIKNIKQEDYIDPKYFYILIGLHIKPCLTTLGQKNVNQILPEFYKLLDLDYKKSKINYLYRLYVFQTEKTPLISRGESTQYVKSIVIKTIHLTNSPTNDFAKECVKNLAREAENIWREKNDIPKINEGWSSEMALFREIHSALESFDVDVKHHVRLSFLGQQHYDIYIPKHKIAIEYQGDQHFRPVDFFGGEKVFKQNQERDLRKKQLSKKNDIKLIEVLPDYHINSLIKTVLE
ncbi:MAG: hypothetical protein LBM09_03005, partial [Candidatus Nomurabacteria bacterium]|nr:hypothetical protein [Candidatus Nomurabacteria bacterium]